ncbi:MAG: tRNA 2-thiouridine(34) synthase MnmA [Elusimicrobiota bacterium]|jgi:tRNA-specific 2-thiouridylase
MTQKVAVAMSGGVDSSVAAALLKEQGYDVLGITLQLHDRKGTGSTSFDSCCGSSDMADARSVAETLGIPHYYFDYVDNFRESVISYFKESYLAGETPNPCIACNQYVKFDRLLRQAETLGADYLATGHYARIENNGQCFVLKKAIDPDKDQSYVLYRLHQPQLSRLLFPIGHYTKPQIRELAHRLGLQTADKPDSQEICFVPNNDYREFLAGEIPEGQRPAGPIRHKDGRLLGRHKGLPFYTIGQREGLGVAVGHPLYVTGIDRRSNTLVVGRKEDVMASRLIIREVSWGSGQIPGLPRPIQLKIRYKHKEAPATLDAGSEGMFLAVFEKPQSAITPGQAAVFYEGETVLGGGVIDHAI